MELTRLPIARQRRVGIAIREMLADKAPNKSSAMPAPVKAAATVVEGLIDRLDPGYELPVLLLDKATDSVYYGFRAVVEGIEQCLDSRIVKELSKDQLKKKVAATTLAQRALADDMGYLAAAMSLQYTGMLALVDKLNGDTQCKGAVEELGLGYLVEHMEAHLAPYGRAVKAADGRDMEAESAAFHEAFEDLLVAARAHAGKSSDLYKKLRESYDFELEAHRKDRAARRRNKNTE